MYRTQLQRLVALTSTISLMGCAVAHMDMGTPISIAGRVLDVATLEPVPMAEVAFVDVSLDDSSIRNGPFRRADSLADADGRFELSFYLWWGRTVRLGDSVDQGEFDIEISALGFSPRTFRFDLDEVRFDADLGADRVELGDVVLSRIQGDQAHLGSPEQAESE